MMSVHDKTFDVSLTSFFINTNKIQLKFENQIYLIEYFKNSRVQRRTCCPKIMSRYKFCNKYFDKLENIPLEKNL